MSKLSYWKNFNVPKPYKPIEKRVINRNIVPAAKIDPKFGLTTLPFNEKPRVIADFRSMNKISKEQKKEEKQMKEVYDKVILNGGKKKTAEEKIMDQVINGK